jgi:hypothetical protein
MIKLYMDETRSAAAGRYLADRGADSTAYSWNDLDPAEEADRWAEDNVLDSPKTVYVLGIAPDGERREWVCRRRVAYDAEVV